MLFVLKAWQYKSLYTLFIFFKIVQKQMESDIFLIESDRLIKYLKIWRKKMRSKKRSWIALKMKIEF